MISPVEYVVSHVMTHQALKSPRGGLGPFPDPDLTTRARSQSTLEAAIRSSAGLVRPPLVPPTTLVPHWQARTLLPGCRAERVFSSEPPIQVRC